MKHLNEKNDWFSFVNWFKVVALKKAIRDLEQKVQDQEEELDDQAGQIQMLEQVSPRRFKIIIIIINITTLFKSRIFPHRCSTNWGNCNSNQIKSTVKFWFWRNGKNRSARIKTQPTYDAEFGNHCVSPVSRVENVVLFSQWRVTSWRK